MQLSHIRQPDYIDERGTGTTRPSRSIRYMIGLEGFNNAESALSWSICLDDKAADLISAKARGDADTVTVIMGNSC